MNKYDLVKLINLKEDYAEYNLYLDAQGVITDINGDKIKVLFFNEHNQGDYAYIDVDIKDVLIVPNAGNSSFSEYIEEYSKSFTFKEKGFKKKEFEIYSEVELLVEEERYTKYDVHKGDVGVIVEDYAVKDYVLVDFGRFDKNNNYVGDCIAVKLNDLKILDKNRV